MFNLKSYILALLIIASFSMIVAAQRNSSSQIEGRIVTEDNSPVYNAFVELYNDTEFLVSRTRSTSQGRFMFRNLRPGVYVVRIKPFGTNLKDSSERLQLIDQGTMPTFEYLNVVLEIDRRFSQPTETIIGTIYAQEIPKEAKQLFDSGVKKLRDQDKKGIDDIEAATKLFPDYFEALNTLGREYIKQGKYELGYPFLLRAIDINSRCPECFYGLTVSFYKLNQVEAGLRAAKATVTLSPNSADSQLLLGILLRLNKNYAESEKALLEAKKLFKDPNSEVHWQLALLYNNMNQNDKGVAELELYLKADPNAKNKEEVKKTIKTYRSKQKAEKP